MEGKSKFSEIIKGELFRFPGKKKVYRFDGFDKVSAFRFYRYTDTEDINNTQYTRKDRIILIGFIY